MMARSKARLAKEESLIEHELDALPVDEESSAEEIHALIEREKDDFITLEEYAKRRGISL
jgi:hypothetical protein